MKRLVSVVGLATILLASQAFAFGVAVAPPHIGSIGNVNVAPKGFSGVNVNGAVTIRGIILLPNGGMIVPAVTPRPQLQIVAPEPVPAPTIPEVNIETPIQIQAVPRSGSFGKNLTPPYGQPCQYQNCR